MIAFFIFGIGVGCFGMTLIRWVINRNTSSPNWCEGCHHHTSFHGGYSCSKSSCKCRRFVPIIMVPREPKESSLKPRDVKKFKNILKGLE